MHDVDCSSKWKCDGGLYTATDAFVHLDCVQPKVSVCYGVGRCISFWRNFGLGELDLAGREMVRCVHVGRGGRVDVDDGSVPE